jgi:hypothetical protein
MNAGVIPSWLDADMTAFRETKEKTIFLLQWRIFGLNMLLIRCQGQALARYHGTARVPVKFVQEGKPGPVSRDERRWDGQQPSSQAPGDMEVPPEWRESDARKETTAPSAGKTLRWRVGGGEKPDPGEVVSVAFLAGH